MQLFPSQVLTRGFCREVSIVVPFKHLFRQVKDDVLFLDDDMEGDMFENVLALAASPIALMSIPIGLARHGLLRSPGRSWRLH